MDAIALGCLTGLATEWLARRRAFASGVARSLLVAVQIAGSVTLLWIGFWLIPLTLPLMLAIERHGLKETVLPIATCLIMAASVLRGQPGSRVTAPIRWLGRHSYELYLTHWFVVLTAAAVFVRLRDTAASAPHAHLAAALTAPGFSVLCLWSALVFTASGGLAALTAHFFTEPANRLLRGAAPPENLSRSAFS